MSNQSIDCFPDNSLSSFTNLLPNELSSQKYINCKIALETLSFQTNFLNLPKFFHECSKQFMVSYSLPINNDVIYTVPIEGRLTELKYSFKGFFYALSLMFTRGRIHFGYNSTAKKIKLNGINARMTMDVRIASWLGFDIEPADIYIQEGQTFYQMTFGARYTAKEAENEFLFRPATPRVINVVMNNLQTVTASTNRTAKTLALIPFAANTGETFYYEVAQKEWMSINMLNVSSLSIALFDENGDKLNIGFGQPTIVWLRIITMGSEMFTMRISSLEQDGTNSSFRALLKEPLPLGENNWQVALSSIHFPNEFEKISYDDAQKGQMIIFRDAGYMVHNFGKKDYESAESLIEAINIKIRTVVDGVGAEVSIDADEKIRFYFRTNFTLVFSHNLSVILGLTDLPSTEKLDPVQIQILLEQAKLQIRGNKDIADQMSLKGLYPTIYGYNGMEIFGSNTINVDRLSPALMFLFCDIIKPVMIGSNQSKILKMIPVKKRKNLLSSYYECKRLDFEPLSETHVSSIQLELYKADGDLVHFEKNNAEVLYTFVFRKI
jgi:hypothetical protein